MASRSSFSARTRSARSARCPPDVGIAATRLHSSAASRNCRAPVIAITYPQCYHLQGARRVHWHWSMTEEGQEEPSPARRLEWPRRAVVSVGPDRRSKFDFMRTSLAPVGGQIRPWSYLTYRRGAHPSLLRRSTNAENCPTPAVRDTRRDRLNWVESRASPKPR